MNEIELLQLAEEIHSLSNRHKSHNTNIISELHANENAHSRILRMFLQYDDGSLHFPIFKKFLDIPKIRDVINIIECNNPKFTNEQERIDVLIEEYPTYAIIIENKIYGATDQDAQLERYIKCVQNHGIKDHNIYAIYLTKDGEKDIDENSLTDIAKEVLCYTSDNNGRFIPLNYRYDILPWLEEIVLPNCPIKETLLISALNQYIDYLKEILELNQNNEKQEIMNILKNSLKIETIQDCINVTDRLKTMTDKINVLRDEMANTIGTRYIEKPFKDFLEKIDLRYNAECIFSYSYIRIKVTNPQWTDFYFNVNFENPIIYGIVNYDIEKPCTSINANVFIENGFKQSRWWPAYKSFERRDLRNPSSPEFWHQVELGEFEQYLENKFKEILDLIG